MGARETSRACVSSLGSRAEGTTGRMDKNISEVKQRVPQRMNFRSEEGKGDYAKELSLGVWEYSGAIKGNTHRHLKK